MLVMLPVIAFGQKTLLNTSDLDQKFSQVWKESEASKKKYSWKSKTEVTRDDKVIQVLVEEFSPGLNGRLIRKVISNQEAPLPSTFIIRMIAEEQKAKIISLMSGLHVFLEKYALDDDSIRHSFFSKASISKPDARGQLLISGSNVIAKGDKLKWWIDTRSYSITNVSVSTIFNGISAEFFATYYLLPGLNYMSQANIRVPSKNMVIKLQFYDFIKR
jgi:hypothetical protein